MTMGGMAVIGTIILFIGIYKSWYALTLLGAFTTTLAVLFACIGL